MRLNSPSPLPGGRERSVGQGEDADAADTDTDTDGPDRGIIQASRISYTTTAVGLSDRRSEAAPLRLGSRGEVTRKMELAP